MKKKKKKRRNDLSDPVTFTIAFISSLVTSSK